MDDFRFAVLPVFTLLVAGSVATMVSGIWLLIVRRQMREAAALPWWTAALFIRSAAGMLLACGFGWTVRSLMVAGSALLPLAATALWSGVRVFHARRALWWLFVIITVIWITVIWLLAAQVPLPVEVPAAALASGMALSAMVQVAACFELWRGRDEKLTARRPLTAVIGFNAAVLMIAAFNVALGDNPTSQPPPLLSWFSLTQLVFDALLLAAAVLAVMMCQERRDARALYEAKVDFPHGRYQPRERP